MTDWRRELRTPATRRTLLGGSAGVGLLLATAVPTGLFADAAPVAAPPMPGSGASDPFKNIAASGIVTGTATGAFRGMITVTGFYQQAGNLVALTYVDGMVLDRAGRAIQRIQGSATGPAVAKPGAGTAPAASAIQQAATTTTSTSTTATSTTTTIAGCQILNLVLGPLYLNLLGLVVSIPTPIVLNIVAVPGAGNLLGNLLCDIANLLNQPTLDLAAIVTDLNNILAQFGL